MLLFSGVGGGGGGGEGLWVIIQANECPYSFIFSFFFYSFIYEKKLYSKFILLIPEMKCMVTFSEVELN